MAFIAGSWCRSTAGTTAATTDVEPVKTGPVVPGRKPRWRQGGAGIGASLAELGTKKGMNDPGAIHGFLRTTDRKLHQRRCCTGAALWNPGHRRGSQPATGDRPEGPGNQVEEEPTQGQCKDTHAEHGGFDAAQGIGRKRCEGLVDWGVLPRRRQVGQVRGGIRNQLVGDRGGGTMGSVRYLVIHAEDVHREQAKDQRHHEERRAKPREQGCSAFVHGGLPSLKVVSSCSCGVPGLKRRASETMVRGRVAPDGPASFYGSACEKGQSRSTLTRRGRPRHRIHHPALRLAAAALIGVGITIPLGFNHLAAITPPERMGGTMESAELGREIGDAGGHLLVDSTAMAVSIAAEFEVLALLAAVASGPCAIFLRTRPPPVNAEVQSSGEPK